MKDKTIDYILRATWQAVSRMYNEEASKYGGTMATGFVLLSIDKDKGTPSTALGPKMGMEATSLTRTLKTMEEKGLILRKKNPEDGRGVLIYLTDFGKEKSVPYHELLGELLEFIDDVVDDLDCRKEVEYAWEIMKNGTGADRQLKVFEETGDLTKVVDYMISETEYGITHS